MFKSLQLFVILCSLTIIAECATSKTLSSNVSILRTLKNLIQPDGYTVTDETAVLTRLNQAITDQDFDVNTVIPHLKMFRCITIESTPDAVDEIYNYTLLHFAVEAGMAEVVQRLLQARANPNIKSYSKGTPFQVLVNTISSESCTDTLLTIGQTLINYGAKVTTAMIRKLTETLKLSEGEVDTTNLKILLHDIARSRKC